MPANPNSMNNNPFEVLQGLMNGNQSKPAWWTYSDGERITWDGDRVPAFSTGLFYRAAIEKKEVFELRANNKPFKLSDDCKDPKEESERLAIEMFKEIHALKLNPLITWKVVKEDPAKQIRIYHNEDSVLSFKIMRGKDIRSFDVTVYSFDENLVDRVREIVLKYADLSPKDPDLYIMSEDEDGRLALRSIGKPGITLERGNYNPDVLEAFDYVTEQLVKKDPFGRLVIMHGVAGSGKTHLLKSLITEMDLDHCKFISLQPEFLYRFNISSLTRVLLDASSEGESLVLLIEDADDCLVSRQSDNIVAISTLLNFADGFVGNMLDMRIITTTNAKELLIDSALKRNGRMCRIINVDKLEPEIANKAYQRISGKDTSPFNAPVVLADVYAEAYKERGIESNVGSIPTASSGLGFARE